MRTSEEEFVSGNMDILTYATKIGHKVLYRTELFGKSYVWMKDTSGTLYLERLSE